MSASIDDRTLAAGSDGPAAVAAEGPPGDPAAPSAPRVHEGGWSAALALARELREPVFVPVRPHVDDRGWSFMNLFAGAMSAEGQVNFSVQHPGVVKAWHRHDRQTDFWCCVHGHLKAGVHRSDGRTWIQVFGTRRPGVLVIPPPLWHGAVAVGEEPAGLLYYVTRAYDPTSPDEHRRPPDGVPGFPWGPRAG